MIQATQTKTIDPKATKVAQGVGNKKGAEALLGAESLVEGQEFANELSASLGEEAKVKPTELTAEQLLKLKPEMIQKEQEAGSEVVNPKIFDPSMTKGVEKLIQPKTTQTQVTPKIDLNQLQTQVAAAPLTDAQVLQLANGEIQAVQNEVSQAVLKTPQVQVTEDQASRSPAIDFAKNEVDPQLMNMEDFVAQKNLVNKKSLPHGYGIHHKPEVHKHALENGLKTTQTITETTPTEGIAAGAVSSQQFILNMMNEQQGAPAVADAQAPQKVFDMSQIKSENSNQIMNQISDYIVQAKASKEPTVSMRVNHEELGLIDITVSKAGIPGMNADSVAINIGTHSTDGKNFFQQNSKDLFSHLGQAGVNVSDLKFETSQSSTKNDFDMNQQNRQSHSQGERHFGSEQNQRRHDSNRRQELWDLLKDKEAA